MTNSNIKQSNEKVVEVNGKRLGVLGAVGTGSADLVAAIGQVMKRQHHRNQYEIKNRLSNTQLKEALQQIEREYKGRVYRHRNGTQYLVTGSTVININNTAYYGLVYEEFTGEPFTPNHSRPMHEFLDGRFTEVTLESGKCEVD